MGGANVVLWEALTTIELRELGGRPGTVAILPVAAIEQHGPHLPLATDALIGDGILDEALALLDEGDPVLRLPTQRIGHSPEHAAFAGTLSLPAPLLLAAWTELGRAVARAGVRRLLLFNSHGGQGSLVDLTAQALRAETGLLVARCNYYRLSPPHEMIPEEEGRYGLHGGLVETSLMLRLAPQQVRRQNLARFRSAAEDLEVRFPGLTVEGAFGIAWQAEDLNATGVTGDACAASAALGERLLAHYAAATAAAIAALRCWPLPVSGGAMGVAQGG